MSTRSLNQPAAASVPGTAAPAPAATTPGVGPARGVDAQLPISLSPPAQRVEPPTALRSARGAQPERGGDLPLNPSPPLRSERAASRDSYESRYGSRVGGRYSRYGSRYAGSVGDGSAAGSAVATTELGLAAAASPASTVLLEVAMWSGAWGLLDALVDLLAPEDVRARLLLYLALLAAAQLSPWCRADSPRNSQLLPLLQARLPDAAVKGCGFLTALCLCSGSWGIVDVVVERLSLCLGVNSGSLARVLSYGGLVLATAIGVASHRERAAILESLSQVSWT